MEDKTKIILGVGGVAIAIWLLMGRANAMGNPVDWTVPFGGQFPPNSNPAGFQTEINVKADPNLLGMLDQKYMPLFGFVGMTTTGSLPGQINVTAINVMENMAASQKPVERVQVPVNAVWYENMNDIAKRYGAKFTNRPGAGVYEVLDKQFINGSMWYQINDNGAKKWVDPVNNNRPMQSAFSGSYL